MEYSCITMLVSTVEQSESAIRIHISPLFWISFPNVSYYNNCSSSICWVSWSKVLWPFHSVSTEPDRDLTKVINKYFLSNEDVIVALRRSGPNYYIETNLEIRACEWILKIWAAYLFPFPFPPLCDLGFWILLSECIQYIIRWC